MGVFVERSGGEPVLSLDQPLFAIVSPFCHPLTLSAS